MERRTVGGIKMHQFSRDELREMFNESICEAKELAKQKGASVYYGIGDLL